MVIKPRPTALLKSSASREKEKYEGDIDKIVTFSRSITPIDFAILNQFVSPKRTYAKERKGDTKSWRWTAAIDGFKLRCGHAVTLFARLQLRDIEL